MNITIFYSLIILAVISSGTAFAENSLISVQTNNSVYDEGDYNRAAGGGCGATPLELGAKSANDAV